jgi:hypothetical protein
MTQGIQAKADIVTGSGLGEAAVRYLVRPPSASYEHVVNKRRGCQPGLCLDP